MRKYVFCKFWLKFWSKKFVCYTRMRSLTLYFILFYTNDVTDDVKSFQKIYTFAHVLFIIAELHDAKCIRHGKLRQKSPKKWDLYSATLRGRTFIFCSSFRIESHRKSLVTESKSKLNVWKTFLKRFATCLQLKKCEILQFWHLNMWNKGQKWPTPVVSRNDVINAEKCTLFKPP